jgi:hypothetical protein
MTASRTCAKCGQTLPDKARFCGKCGEVVDPSPLATLVGFEPHAQPVDVPAGAPGVPGPAATTVAAAAPIAAGPRPLQKTMIGMAVPGVTTPAATPAPGRTQTIQGLDAPAARLAPPAPATVPAARPGVGPSLKGTMLGVARPGIAPSRAGEAPAEPPSSSTMSVLSRTAAVPVAHIPAPAPLVDVPPPSPPRFVRRRGVPLAGAALLTGALVVLGGVTIALRWRSSLPIVAQARVSTDGRDALHLTCNPQSCRDGTAVRVAGAQSTFAAGLSDLPLPAPLRIGDNPVDLQVERPGSTRVEPVHVNVAVAYRVRADVSTMSAAKPSFTIHVQALPGSQARVAGADVPIDAAGSGIYAVDETAETEGPADESRVVAAEVPYVITAPGRAAEQGTVTARVSVAPLRVDAPGARAVVEEAHAVLAGRAPRGATVTVDGAPVAPGVDGAFETSIVLPSLGERTVAVRAETAALVARTVHVTVRRVASLEREAKAFEQQPTIGYDAAMKDLQAAVGQAMAVEGEVIDARGSGHRTLVLLDDKRGCRKGPCLVRVVVGHDVALPRGATLRAWGRVARAFPVSGGAVPEVEADFVLVPRR